MVREDPKPPLLIHIAWIGINLREILEKTVVFEDCLYEEEVGITHHPQITPKPNEQAINTIQHNIMPTRWKRPEQNKKAYPRS